MDQPDGNVQSNAILKVDAVGVCMSIDKTLKNRNAHL